MIEKDFDVKEFKIYYEIKKQMSESVFADTEEEAKEIFHNDHLLEEIELLDILEV